MKVFMSWSGLRSKAVAELIANWAKCVVQATQPWISTSGIDRGAVWFSAINDELTNTSVGIICLTHENKNKPWILFEAGALAKGLVNSRVCTFLVDLTPTDLESPLSQFNHTAPDEEGLWNLARTLNSSVQTPLETPILEQVFDIHWPVFETRFKEILETYPQNVVPEVRSNDSILNELLESSRSINNRLRVVEERTGYIVAPPRRVLSLAELPRKSNDSNNTGGVYDPSFSDGMTIAHNALKNGIGMNGIQNRLIQAGFSPSGISEIIETLDKIINSQKTPSENVRSSGPID